MANGIRWDSCILYAIRRYLSDGGYVCIRMSRRNRWPFIRWPHLLWGPSEIAPVLEHFVPLDNAGETDSVPIPWFKGREKIGDEE